MGTHPIFESDFDCLTDQIKMHFFAHHLADHLDTLPPCYLKHGVKLVDPSSLTDLPPNTLINVHVRVVGGKGGFGSLLRAIGSQIERTTDQNSKRNLDGRRLRDIEHEKTVEEQRKLKKPKKTVDGQHGGKHYFEDTDYIDAKKESTEATVNSVQSAKKLVEQRDKIREAQVAEERRMADVKRAENDGVSSDESGSDLEDEFMPKKTPVITGPVLTSRNVTANTKTQRHNAVMWSHMTGKNYDQVKKVEIIKYEDINWGDYEDAASLEQLGAERLTELLMLRALKTGGSIEEKAARLMRTRNVEPDAYPVEIRAQGR